MRSHYDRGNEFYRLWLDRDLVYSCAYFRTGTEDIHTAQQHKLEHICRKLRLEPGERLLDIGCGWGGLVRYAARHFGVDALGITVSREQAAFAEARIAAEGLGEHCRVELCDYRDLATEQPFDKVVSVGMVEHVGLARLPSYFATAFSLTRPGGLFLNHGITAAPEDAPSGRGARLAGWFWGRGAFMERHIFPDGEIPPLARVVDEASRAGFEVRDVETLREHYAATLRHWLRRLERNEARARAAVGDATVRTWRLYLAGCAHGFAIGRVSIAQTLLSRPGAQGRCGLPWTRDYVYRTRNT